MKRVWVTLLLVVLVFVVIVVGGWFLLPLLVEYWWYKDLGVSSLLWRKFAWNALWVIGAFWFPWLGYWLWFGVLRQYWKKSFVFLVLFLGIISAGVMWLFRDVTLAWLVPSSGVRDGLFKIDVMWYVSWLPFWRFLVLYGLGYVGLLWGLDRLFVSSSGKRDWLRIGLLFSLLMLGVVCGMLFSFELFVWQPNKRLGIGFSDFYGTLVAWWVVVGVGAGLLFLWTILLFFGRLSLGRWLTQVLIATLLAFLVIGFWPWGLSQLYEKPNELRAQRRFVKARRMATREAFGLRYEPFVFTPDLESLLSVRLWDIEPYLQNIRQLQTIRNYFDFFDADVDFYRISNRLQQVLIACRELTLSNFLPEVQTWENMHLRYTHGLGVVVSPANSTTPEGQPIFWVKNLSQETDREDFVLRQPQLYFGESSLPYVMVRTEVPEFEYTDVTNRVEISYTGTNGVRLSFFARLAFARAFGEKNILLTRYFRQESGVLWKRQIVERLHALVPELAYDPDPYPVVLNGEVFWVIDAYTTTSRYPLAETYESRWGHINGIRNSVKVVVSAYTGFVRYYVVDKTDPLLSPIRFFARELFSEDIPEGIRDHFRYPYALLALQAEVFSRYHMDSDESFYNGDDVWTIPLVKQGNTNLPYEPFYVLLETAEGSVPGVFVPFTPLYRQNLSGWLFGVYENGLRLYQYVSPRTESIPGPSQVYAQIYQNDELAKLFTLWGQRNSVVSLGMVRYLPLGHEVMAVVPLYISSQYNAIPQMTLVIALYRNRIYYGKDTFELRDMIRKDVLHGETGRGE